MNILDDILRYKKEELKLTKSRIPLPDLKARIRDMDAVRPFRAAVKRERQGPVRLIAEVKKASPSEGIIREDFDLSAVVSAYERSSAAAISVLTEGRFFAGSLEYLGEARRLTLKPVLRKDFIFDEYQVYETRANHADAVLLIAAALERSQLSDLYALACELSLDCLVEIRTLKELDTALYCGAGIIGINNRDLGTLDISLKTTFDFLKDIPDDRIVVSESGINTRADIEALEATRTDAVLVGTAIMKAPDIEAGIRELTGRE